VEELFEEIKNSKIPIITAIGHENDKGDKLLITNVSDMDFSTPTALANNLNREFYKPLQDKINSFIDVKKQLYNELHEQKNNNLYDDLELYIKEFLRNKFGGNIIEIGDDENNIIIKKNGKYYNNYLKFDNDNELEFTEQDLISIDNLNDALNKKNINNLCKNFNDLNNSKNKLSTNILKKIDKIKENDRLKEEFLDVKSNKNETYYLKPIPKTKKLNVLIEIKRLLLWYKDQIEASMNGKDIENIKDIYDFIKNTLYS